MAYINNNNFVSWSTVVEPCDYALPLVTGDKIGLMTNMYLNNLINPFADLRLGLWSEETGIYIFNIPKFTLTTAPGLAPDEYLIYTVNWTVPDLPNNENFRFILYNDPATILYYSNSFREVANTEYTSVVEYRNSNDAYGFLYASAPTFYNKFRVDLWTGRPNYNENKSGYETYEGDFIQVKSDIQKIREFQTRFMDEVSHEAFFSMLSHSDIEIDGIAYKKQPDQSYTIEWSEFDDNKIGNGIVNLLRVDYSEAIINCN